MTLQVTTTILPSGWFELPYRARLESSAETGPTWKVSAGALPLGLTLAEDGTLDGRPQQEGSYSFQVLVSASGTSATQDLQIFVDRKRWLMALPDYGDAHDIYAVDVSEQVPAMTPIVKKIGNGLYQLAAFSPDGKSFVYSTVGTDLQLVDVSGKSLVFGTNITAEQPISSLAWSPDSKKIAYRAGTQPPSGTATDGAVYVVDLSQGASPLPVRVADAGVATLGWVDESTLVFSSRAKNLTTVTWDGMRFGAPHEVLGSSHWLRMGVSSDRKFVAVMDIMPDVSTRIVHLDDDSVETIPGRWDVSPNGKFIYSWSAGVGGDIRAMARPSLGLGKLPWREGSVGAWSWFHANDRLIWASGGNTFGVSTLADSDLDTVVIPGFTPAAMEHPGMGFVASDDGWVAAQSSDATYVGRMAGSGPQVLQRVSAPLLAPHESAPSLQSTLMAFAPSAARLVYVSVEDSPGVMDVYWVDLTGDGAPKRTRLTPPAPPNQYVYNPAWSADSSTVAFATMGTDVGSATFTRVTAYIVDGIHGNAATPLPGPLCGIGVPCPVVYGWAFQP